MMVDLHVHTKYSLLDAIIEPEELVLRAKELGRDAVCVTDHGNTQASVDTYLACKEHGIKYMHGVELYVCEDAKEKDNNNKYNHLIVIAKNEQGRINMNNLISESTRKENFYYRPRVGKKEILEYKDGLIVTSACMGGEVSAEFMKYIEGDIPYEEAYKNAKREAMWYKNIFGDDFYIELQSHDTKEQLKLNRCLVDLANDIGVKYIVTTDAHFLNKEDQKYQRMWFEISLNNVSDDFTEAFNGCYIQTDEEIIETCSKSLSRKEVELAMSTTLEIVSKCDVHMPLSDPRLPHFKVPEEYENEIDYIKHMCADGWIEKKINEKDNTDEYIERLNYEMNAIEEMGYEGYFAIVEDYKSKTNRVGPGRGSAGGTLVGYLMDIIDIDPIEYGLYFERFIDVSQLELIRDGIITKGEAKMPDIDLDFGRADREDVLNYLVEAHGHENVCAIGTFQYTYAKGAIRDIAKVLGIDYEKTDEMAKTIEGVVDFKELMEDKSAPIHNYKDDYPVLFEYAEKLSGLPKSFGQHACGYIVSDSPIMNFSPTDISNPSMPVLHLDMDMAEALGLVKFDLLGLRTLDVIYDTLEMIGKDYNYIAPHLIDLNDEKVWEEFKAGNTEGIFQFSSQGMQETLRSMEANSIGDLTVANALYRPGSMRFIGDYTNRKKGLEKPVYLHEDLKPILEETYGIIVFQEQLIEVGRLAGLQNPDELRQATGKKDLEKMAKIKPELMKGLVSRGWTEEIVEELWDIMYEFANYSFNKSHSAGYSILAYITMYLKVHHPMEFVTSWINSYNGKIDELKVCYKEAKRLGVSLTPPVWGNIGGLTHIAEIDGVKSIVIGTATLKNLNESLGEKFSKFQHNSYNNFLDLAEDAYVNGISNSELLQLVKLNTFKELGSPADLEGLLKLSEWIDRKLIFKDRIDESPFTLEDIKRYSKHETAKQYREIDFKTLILEKANNLTHSSVDKFELIKNENEFIGVPLTLMWEWKNEDDIRNKLTFVSDVKSPFWMYGGTIMYLYRLNTGIIEEHRLNKWALKGRSVEVGDIVETIRAEETIEKNVFQLTAWRKWEKE